MASQEINRFTFDYPPDLVLKVLTTPEFHEANLKGQGNPAARVYEKSRSDDKLVLECEVTEYKKGVRGIDKKRTELTYTTFEWDLVGKKGSWTWRNPNIERVKVWGAIRIEPQGEGTLLTEEFYCEVRIPLVGGRVEKKVCQGAAKHMPKYETLVNEFCAKSPP